MFVIWLFDGAFLVGRGAETYMCCFSPVWVGSLCLCLCLLSLPSSLPPCLSVRPSARLILSPSLSLPLPLSFSEFFFGVCCVCYSSAMYGSREGEHGGPVVSSALMPVPLPRSFFWCSSTNSDRFRFSRTEERLFSRVHGTVPLFFL